MFFAFALLLVPAFASAQVIGGGGTVNKNPNGSYSASFTVTGTTGHIYDFSASCTGYVATCGTPSPDGLSARTGHLSATATVTYTTGSSGSGTLTFQTFDESSHGIVYATLNVSPVSTATPTVLVSPNPNYSAESYATNDTNFSVKNNGNSASTYNLSVVCSGNISACSVPTPTASVGAGSSKGATVYYTTGPWTSGNGTATLTATSTLTGESANTSVTVVPLSPAVSVTPDGGTPSPEPGAGANVSVPFTVTDVGNSSPITYSLACGYSGVVTSCSVSPSVYVYIGSPQTVNVSYTTSSNLAGGTGQVTLTANASGYQVRPYSDAGSYNVSVADTRTYSVAVTPTAFDDYTAENVSTNYGFTVTNNGNTGASYALSASCTGGETSCSVAPSVYVGAGSSTPVAVYFNTSPAGSTGHVTLVATGPSNSSTGQIHVIPLSEAVSVSAGTSSTTINQSNSQLLGFTISAVGNNTSPITYTLGTVCTRVVTCPATPTPSSVTITPGSPGSSSILATASSNPAGGSGTATLSASYTNSWGQLYQSSAATAITSPDVRNDSVVVTPKNDSIVSAAPNTSTSYGFKIRNAGNNSATYSLSITSCTGTASGTGGCTFATGGNTITVNSGATGTAPVYFSTGPVNQVITIGLHATVTTPAGLVYSDDGLVEIIPSIHGAPAIDISKANFGETVTRDRCLTVSLGKGAAYNCGDLRLVHAFPTIQTYTEPRTPALIYDSRDAAPRPIVSADVILAADSTLPPTVSESLKVAGVTRATGTWTGSVWGTPGTARRIALSFDASSLATGVYPYTVTVTSNFSSGPLSTSASGNLIIVNRSASSGWSVAGVEQLLFPTDTSTRLWIGGDGSARLYHWASPNVWKAASVDRPDSLTLSGSTYTRWDDHRLQVQFDASGRHVATVTRQGHATTFGYSGTLMTSITVPGTSSAYSLFYTGSAIDSVKCLDRKVTLTRGASSLTITDPDGSTVRYDYAGSTAIINKRTDQLGNATTYQLDSVSSTLSGVSVAMESPAPAIVTTFRTAEGAALAGPISSDSVYTLVNGPRTDTTITKVWIDRFGEPTKIVNALGGSTLLQRTDSRFPALVTQMTDPTGFVTTATYDSHGNDSTVTRHNPLGDSSNSTTSYTWNQTYDFITGITQPTGETMTMVYDPTTGNRTSQYPGTSSSRAVQFFYDPVTKNLSASQLPGTTARDSVAYDSLGNVRLTRTPLGHQTMYVRDAEGRVTQTAGPLDTAGHRHMYTSVQYDRMGCDTLSLTYSDSAYYYASDSLYTHKAYDAEGNLLSVKNESHPLVGTIGTIKTVTTYDALDRETGEYTIGSAGDTVTVKRFTYDAAGNRTNGGSDGGSAVSASFDALNRQVRRKSLDDSASYTYDAAGRLLTANNRYAQVARGYYPGGALKVDTLRIAVTDTTVGVPTRFASHVYRDSITYDASERRAKLVYPDNSIATYSYDPVFGNIATIVGPASKAYSMQYDLTGRLAEQVRLSGTADSVYESFGYDDDSRLVRDTVKGAGVYASTSRTGSVQYDARDKVLSAPNSIAPEAFTYSPLGAVTIGNTMSGASEEFTVDALGNSYSHELNGVTSTYNYHAGTTRLDMMLTPNGIYTDTTRYAYDKDGNRLDETTSHYLSDPTPGFTNDCAPVGDAVCINMARSYSYNAENLLTQTYVMIDSSVTHPPYYPYTTDEHFRYDALGRRVWARMNHSANCDKEKPWGGCYNTLLRSMWDGDQLIYEIQVPADSNASLESDSPSESGSYGIVSYVHGAELDTPLAIYKGGGLAVLPFANYRGEMDIAACPWGSCSDMPMPGLTDGLNHLDGGTTSGPTGFYGTLEAGGKTGSGLVYQRNRYVDPQTGKFTHADPIGLAGGVNAWGFVGGDPVSYADPFGLCPECFEEALDFVEDEAPVVEDAAAAAGEELSGAVQNLNRATSRAFDRISSSLQSMRSQINHIAGHVGEREHLSTAAQESKGTLQISKPMGGFFDHVKETRDAMQGLSNSITRLTKILGNPNLSTQLRKQTTDLLSKASTTLDAMESALK